MFRVKSQLVKYLEILVIPLTGLRIIIKLWRGILNVIHTSRVIRDFDCLVNILDDVGAIFFYSNSGTVSKFCLATKNCVK